MERKYRELEFPAGTFRQYEDTPDVWIQVMKEGDKDFFQRIEDNFNDGKINGKRKPGE